MAVDMLISGNSTHWTLHLKTLFVFRWNGFVDLWQLPHHRGAGLWMHRDANCHGGKLSRSKLFTASLLLLFFYFYFSGLSRHKPRTRDLEPLNWLCNLFKYVLEPVVAADPPKMHCCQAYCLFSKLLQIQICFKGHILSEFVWLSFHIRRRKCLLK